MQQGHNAHKVVEEFGELVTMDEVDDRLIDGEFTFREGAKAVKMKLRPNIVTVNFLDQMASMEGAVAEAQAAQALAGANRATRRAAGSQRAKKKDAEVAAAAAVLDDAPATEARKKAAGARLEAQRQQMRFMARSCKRVIARWNMAVLVEGEAIPVPVTEEYFYEELNFEQLTALFEYVCFEAAAPKKTGAPTSPVTSATSGDSSSTAAAS